MFNQLLNFGKENFVFGFFCATAIGSTYYWYQRNEREETLDCVISDLCKDLFSDFDDEGLKVLQAKNKRWLEKRVEKTKGNEKKKQKLIFDLHVLQDLVKETHFKANELLWEGIFPLRNQFHFNDNLRQESFFQDQANGAIGLKRVLAHIERFLKRECQKLHELPQTKELVPFSKTTFDLSLYSKMRKLTLYQPHRGTEFPQFCKGTIFKISRRNGKKTVFLINSAKKSHLKGRLRPLSFFLDGSEVTHQSIISKHEYGQLPSSMWAGSNWRKSSSHDYYEEIEKSILAVLKVIDGKKETQKAGRVPRCEEGRFHIVEYCAGKGILAKKVAEKMKNLGSYLVSDLDEDSLQQAQAILGSDNRFSFKKCDIVKEAFDCGPQPPGIIIISGGLTERVLSGREDALRVLKKCYVSLLDGGIIVLAGLRTHLLGPKDFAKHLPFDVLNQTDQTSILERNPRKEFYILQKNCEKEKNWPQVVDGTLDLFIPFMKKKKGVLLDILRQMPTEEIKKVKEINLSDTNVTWEDLQGLGEFCHLKRLKLAGTPLSFNKDLAQLIPKSCHTFDFSGTSITVSELRKFVSGRGNEEIREIVLINCGYLTQEQQIKWRLFANNSYKLNLSFLALYLDNENLINTVVAKYLAKLNPVKIIINALSLKNLHFLQWCLRFLSFNEPRKIRLINPCDKALAWISFFQEIMNVAQGKKDSITYFPALYQIHHPFISQAIKANVRKVEVSEETSFHFIGKLFPNFNSLKLATGDKRSPFYFELTKLPLEELDLRKAGGVAKQLLDDLHLRPKPPFLKTLKRIAVDLSVKAEFLKEWKLAGIQII